MLHLSTLLLQIGVILVAARLTGFLFRWIHQPQVIGEMVAGILLGPSLFGWIAPQLSEMIFPVDSLGYLNALSQIGLILFMFLVGLELNPKELRGRGRLAVITSQSSIIAPFILGMFLALFLYPRLADDSVSFAYFSLFIGVAMSITAFPVLARILSERGLLNTKLGIVAITTAAVNDISGWSILAVLVVLVRSADAGTSLLLTFFYVGIYMLAMIFLIRPQLKRIEAWYIRKGMLTQNMLAFVLLCVLISAWISEWMGIHAFFGAFLVGAVMPKHGMFVHHLYEKLNDFSVVLLLPLFFALTGLRASIGLLDGLEMWFYFALILIVAIAGKIGGTAVAARYGGMTWRESGSLGILMNTRGLVELVLLNIGLDIGVISPVLFTMMVLMALTTTFMTAPLFEWVYYARALPKLYKTPKQEAEEPTGDIL